MQRDSQRNRRASDDPWTGSPSARPAEEGDEAPPPGPSERLVTGAETGLRWTIQSVAVLLWVPFGFLFWLPFLLRRTVAYVFAVLVAGLTGGEPERAGRRWEQAVAFYQLGFRRIVYAFRRERRPEDPAARRARESRGVVRFLLESVWAVLVWAGALWITGVWPEAPEALLAAAVGGWEAVAEGGSRVGAWLQELVGL